jgi:hypothetical protein
MEFIFGHSATHLLDFTSEFIKGPAIIYRDFIKGFASWLRALAAAVAS